MGTTLVIVWLIYGTTMPATTTLEYASRIACLEASQKLVHSNAIREMFCTTGATGETTVIVNTH